MNKQELIEELECLEVPTNSLDYLKGADYANERAISLAKQLKESKKLYYLKVPMNLSKKVYQWGLIK